MAVNIQHLSTEKHIQTNHISIRDKISNKRSYIVSMLDKFPSSAGRSPVKLLKSMVLQKKNSLLLKSP